MRKLLVFAVLTAVFLVLVAGPAAAQGSGSDDSVLVRVNGDVDVPADERHGVVVIVDGDLVFESTATTIVVVNGRADLVGATVETLVVVDGIANLGAGTLVTGDVHLVESDIIRDPTATVEGSIESGAGVGFSRGFWVIGFLFMLGWAVMTVLAGLVLFVGFAIWILPKIVRAVAALLRTIRGWFGGSPAPAAPDDPAPPAPTA